MAYCDGTNRMKASAPNFTISDTHPKLGAVLAAGHRLTVDDAGARARAGHGLYDEREAVGQVIAPADCRA